MTTPAIHDSSDLAATIERARLLLDDGDVQAAHVLASGAYDQAKAAAGYAARVNAGRHLVDKARRLQGDALLIEVRAKQQLADEYDRAQQAGEVRSNGQRGKAVPDENSFSPPSAEEIGLDRKEIHEARKLRDAERREPGIVARAIAARLQAGLEPSRRNLRAAIGTSSATKQERGHNLYETPIEAMRTLLARERFLPRLNAPFVGKGAILRPLEDAGYDVAISDLVDYGTATRHGEVQGVVDFLATHRPIDCDDYDIVENPPYGEVMNACIAHALREHRPRKMALLLNLNFMCGSEHADRNWIWDVCPPARILVFSRRLPMMRRDGYDGKTASSQMNTAWFIWERQPDGTYRGAAKVERVDWKDFVDADALPPLDGGADVALNASEQNASPEPMTLTWTKEPCRLLASCGVVPFGAVFDDGGKASWIQFFGNWSGAGIRTPAKSEDEAKAAIEQAFESFLTRAGFS